MHLGRLILLAMATLSLTSCKPQPTTPLTALDIIREADSIHESRVGFGAQRTEVYEAYLIFRDTHSREQLLEFTDVPNLNIRGYAAKALREKFPDDRFFDLLQNKLKDESRVKYFNCCSLSTLTIGDFYFKQFSKGLTPAQQSQIQNDLLNREHPHRGALDEILCRWKFPNHQLPRVRELLKEGNPVAVIALARAGKEQDFPTIIETAKNHEDLCYYAIEINPQPAFFDFLKKNYSAGSSSTCNEQYFQTLAAFKTPASLSLLERAFEKEHDGDLSRKYYLRDLAKAIQVHQDPIYEELLGKIQDTLAMLEK